MARRKRMTTRVKNGRYITPQLIPQMELCHFKHQYGHMSLIGVASIPAKLCKWCTHIMYKEEVEDKNDRMRSSRPLTHIDMFQF